VVHSPDRNLITTAVAGHKGPVKKALGLKGFKPIYYSVLFTAVAGRLKIMALPFYDTQSKRKESCCRHVIVHY